MKTIERGNLNERVALNYLKAEGLKPVTSNYHSRHGEIDLVMQDGEILVFIEVRYRRANNFGGAAMSVTPAKQRKIALTALHFLQRNKLTEHQCRFDVVAISAEGTSWIKSAFNSPA